jgi:hypothetical protein
VRDNTGHAIRTGRAQYLDLYSEISTGNACSGKGQLMTVILSLPKSA